MSIFSKSDSLKKPNYPKKTTKVQKNWRYLAIAIILPTISIFLVAYLKAPDTGDAVKKKLASLRKKAGSSGKSDNMDPTAISASDPEELVAMKKALKEKMEMVESLKAKMDQYQVAGGSENSNKYKDFWQPGETDFFNYVTSEDRSFENGVFSMLYMEGCVFCTNLAIQMSHHFIVKMQNSVWDGMNDDSRREKTKIGNATFSALNSGNLSMDFLERFPTTHYPTVIFWTTEIPREDTISDENSTVYQLNNVTYSRKPVAHFYDGAPLYRHAPARLLDWMAVKKAEINNAVSLATIGRSFPVIKTDAELWDQLERGRLNEPANARLVYMISPALVAPFEALLAKDAWKNSRLSPAVYIVVDEIPKPDSCANKNETSSSKSPEQALESAGTDAAIEAEDADQPAALEDAEFDICSDFTFTRVTMGVDTADETSLLRLSFPTGERASQFLETRLDRLALPPYSRLYLESLHLHSAIMPVMIVLNKPVADRPELIEGFQDLGMLLQHMVHTVWVDIRDKPKQVKEFFDFDQDETLEIILFSGSAKMRRSGKPERYTGDVTNTELMAQWIMQQLQVLNTEAASRERLQVEPKDQDESSTTPTAEDLVTTSSENAKDEDNKMNDLVSSSATSSSEETLSPSDSSMINEIEAARSDSAAEEGGQNILPSEQVGERVDEGEHSTSEIIEKDNTQGNPEMQDPAA